MKMLEYEREFMCLKCKQVFAVRADFEQCYALAPPTRCPGVIEEMGVKVFHSLAAGLDGVDVVILLRLQKERMLGAFLPLVKNCFWEQVSPSPRSVREGSLHK